MNQIFYGTIVSKISGHFFENPDHITMISESIGDDGETIWSTCTESARILHALEAIIDDVEIDWDLVVEDYAEAILNHLITGEKPRTPDLLRIASIIIQDYQ